MNKELIAQFADFLEKEVGDWEFDFAQLVSKTVEKDDKKCGAVCCAAGWLPRFDAKNWRWGLDGFNVHLVGSLCEYNIKDDISSYFGLEISLVRNVFHNFSMGGVKDNFYGKIDSEVQRSDVVGALRALIK